MLAVTAAGAAERGEKLDFELLHGLGGDKGGAGTLTAALPAWLDWRSVGTVVLLDPHCPGLGPGPLAEWRAAAGSGAAAGGAVLTINVDTGTDCGSGVVALEGSGEGKVSRRALLQVGGHQDRFYGGSWQ